MPAIKNYQGPRPLRVHVQEESHPSRGGRPYSQEMRAAALAGHVEIGVPGVTPSKRTLRRWRRAVVDVGHARPYQHHGNHRPTGLVGSDRFLLLLFRWALPYADAAETAAFIFRNSVRDEPRVYSRAEITYAEDTLGLTRKRGSIIAHQAFRLENVVRRNMFWTMGYPYGRVGIPTMSLIDIDECGIMIEGCNRHYGKVSSGIRVVARGNYGRGVKWTVILAVAATGERWCRINRKSGTTFEDFYGFVQQVLGQMDEAQYADGPRTIMMDNLNVHTNPMIHQLIRDGNHQPLYRPKYSPQDAPIEYVFNTMQAELRTRLHAITDENIEIHVQQVIANMNGFYNYFHFCGY